jgi:hypothetical protein
VRCCFEHACTMRRGPPRHSVLQTAPAQDVQDADAAALAGGAECMHAGAAECTHAHLELALARLKVHADAYTSELLALRRDFLACGRRGCDVAEAVEGMRQRARRADTLGDLAQYGLRRMVRHRRMCRF